MKKYWLILLCFVYTKLVVIGQVTPVVGTGKPGNNGDASSNPTAFLLDYPYGITSRNNDIYFCDLNNGRLCRLSDGIVTTIIKGLSSPVDVKISSTGRIYVAEKGKHRVIEVVKGTAVAVAGTGVAGTGGKDGSVATSFPLNGPNGIEVDANGDVYIADTGNNRIVKLNVQAQTIKIISTGGDIAAPYSLATDDKNILYVSNIINNKILQINLTNNSVGDLGITGLNQPKGILLDNELNLYIADTKNNLVRKRTNAGVITTIASGLNDPTTLAIDNRGDVFLTSSEGNQVQKITASIVTTFNPKSICIGGTTTLTVTTSLLSGSVTYNLTMINQATGQSIVPFSNQPITSAAATFTIATTMPTSVGAGTYKLRMDATSPKSVIGTLSTDVLTINTTPSPVIGGRNVICSGDALSLNVSGGTAGLSTYNWAGPNGFSSTTSSAVIANAASTYSGAYTVTVANGVCSASTSIGVTINGRPIVTLSASPNPICQGNPTTISATVSGGKVSYFQWANALGFSTSSGNPSIVQTPAQSTTYTVTAYGSGECNGTGTLSVSVVPYPNPPTITPASMTVCSGQGTTLTASGCSGTIKWLFNGIENGATGATFNATQQGSYTAKCSQNNCESGVSNTTTITFSAAPTATASANPSSLCAGQTFNLSSSGGGTYVWAGPSGFSSSSQNPQRTSATTAMSGVYSVTVNNNNCTALATISVNVSAQPIVTVLNIPPPVCEGQNFSVQASSGVASSGFNWSGPGGFSSTAATISIGSATLSNDGVYSVTASNGACTSSGSVSVKVNAAPTASIGGSSAICTNSTSNLLTATPNDANAYNYAWTLNGAAVGTNTPTLTPSTSGTYGLIITNKTTNCSSKAGDKAITVTAPPSKPSITASGATTFCSGSSINLTTNATGTYSWSSGQTTSSISVTTAGTFKLTVFNACGTAESDPITVVVNPNPTASIGGSDAICTNSTSNLLTALPNDAATYNYSWTLNGAAAGTNSPTLTPTTSGTYGLIVTFKTTGCAAKATDKSIVVSSPPSKPTITASGTTTICAGSTVNLSASGGTAFSWSWNTGASTQNIVATTARDYIVTVLNSCGNSTSDPITVKVNALPAIALSDVTISGADTYTFPSTIVPVPVSDYTFQWNSSQTGVFTAFTSTSVQPRIGPFSAIQPFSVSVTVVSKITSCSNTASVLVTWSPCTPPVLRIGGTDSDTLICSGVPLTLNATVLQKTGNITVKGWSIDNQTITGTSLSLSVANPAAGTYKIEVFDEGSKCPGFATKRVGIRSVITPEISGPTFVCSGTEIKLNASVNPAGSYTYSWKLGGSQEGTGSSLSVTKGGSYTLEIQDANQCFYTSKASIVELRASPAVIIKVSSASPYVKTPLTVSFISETILPSGLPVSYKWYNNGTVISTATAPTLTLTNVGYYLIKLQVLFGGSDGCSNTSNEIESIIDGTPTIITSTPQATNELDLRVSPNPFVSQCLIETTLPLQEPKATMQLYDGQGREIERWELEGSRRHEVLVAGETLPTGLYLIKLNAGLHTTTKKIVKW